MRITATIRRTDRPKDPPDTIDEEVSGWTIDYLASVLRQRYGPTVYAQVWLDATAYTVTGNVIRNDCQPR